MVQDSSPAKIEHPNCNVRGIAVHGGQVYIALLNSARSLSELMCANTNQKLDVPGQVEHMAVRSCSLWHTAHPLHLPYRFRLVVHMSFASP